MTPQLRSMLVIVGTLTLAGVAFTLSTPQPATRTMAELRDAGIASGQKLVTICPERLTPHTKRRIRANQPGVLRPKQNYGYVARVSVCFGSKWLDGGIDNCARPNGTLLTPFTQETEWPLWATDDAGVELRTDAGSRVRARLPDGGLATFITLEPREPEFVVPSLRANLVGVDPDAGLDGGEDEADDSLQYDLTACRYEMCGAFDAGVEKWANFCGVLNRIALTVPSEVMPNCWVGDGGQWVDDAVVDCRRLEVPMGGGAPVPRWAGCNAFDRSLSVGADCLPWVGGSVAGDSPWLEGY